MAESPIDLRTCNRNRGTSLLILSWVLLSLSGVAVVLRIWIRTKLRHGLSWDDYFIVASLVGILLFPINRVISSAIYVSIFMSEWEADLNRSMVSAVWVSLLK